MSRSPPWLAAATGAVVVLLTGAGALLLGQDANWDLRNYHWYNPYAFLTDRFSIDVAAATYYNPLLDVPYYVVANALGARATTFLLAAMQGCNFLVLYALARRLCARWGTAGHLAIALVAFAGGGQLGLVGTTFYDNVVSLPLLAGLLMALRALEAPTLRASSLGFAAAGALVGAAIGLKLPTAIYGVGFIVACLATSRSVPVAVSRTVSFGTTAALALALFGGFWMWHLWSTFHNPVYPYFNDLFGGEFGLSASYRDERFIPDSWQEALLFPFVLTFDPLQVGEVQFFDGRLPAFFVLLIVSGVLAFRGPGEPGDSKARFAAVVLVVSFVVWESLFAVYRYVITLEMLSPIVAAALIARWRVAARARAGVAIACAVIVVATTRAGDWGHTEWRERTVEVEVPAIARPEATLGLMAGFEPLSWVIPSFPPKIPFVRLQGYWNDPEDGDIGLTSSVRDRIDAHRGDLFLLYAENERSLATRVLAAYGLETNFGECVAVRGNLAAGLRWCQVRRSIARGDGRRGSDPAVERAARVRIALSPRLDDAPRMADGLQLDPLKTP